MWLTMIGENKELSGAEGEGIEELILQLTGNQ